MAMEPLVRSSGLDGGELGATTELDSYPRGEVHADLLRSRMEGLLLGFRDADRYLHDGRRGMRGRLAGSPACLGHGGKMVRGVHSICKATKLLQLHGNSATAP